MLKVLASGTSMFKEGDRLAIGPFSINIFREPHVGKNWGEKVALSILKVEVVNEEKAKSFLGATGMGLVGSTLAGSLGLIVGVLAGGNKNTKVYALSYKDIKFIVESSNKADQQKLDNAVYKGIVEGT